MTDKFEDDRDYNTEDRVIYSRSLRCFEGGLSKAIALMQEILAIDPSAEIENNGDRDGDNHVVRWSRSLTEEDAKREAMLRASYEAERAARERQKYERLKSLFDK